MEGPTPTARITGTATGSAPTFRFGLADSQAATWLTFRAEEFRSFKDELRLLYSTLGGEAAFTTMEGQVSLQLSGDGMGHVLVKARLLDAAGIGNRLHCEFRLDQTYLPAVIDSLEAIDAAWPVLGQP